MGEHIELPVLSAPDSAMTCTSHGWMDGWMLSTVMMILLTHGWSVWSGLIWSRHHHIQAASSTQTGSLEITLSLVTPTVSLYRTPSSLHLSTSHISIHHFLCCLHCPVLHLVCFSAVVLCFACSLPCSFANRAYFTVRHRAEDFLHSFARLF